MSDEGQFVEVPIPDLVENGVLLGANEAFFWPLGLALAWVRDLETGELSGLQVREWQYEDGHHEIIVDDHDAISEERHRRFTGWLSERRKSLPGSERIGIRQIMHDHIARASGKLP